MLLVLDIGNTNIVIGVYDEDKLIYHFRATTNKLVTSDEFGMFLLNMFSYNQIDINKVEGVIISSVVPPIMYSIEHAIRKYFKKYPMIVGPGIKTGMPIITDNPKEVGADRIVNAVSAFHKYGGPLILIDLGTATTYCAVSSKGEYLGGLICPGVKISSEALYEKAAKLPRIELSTPKSVIGKNTVDGMKAGVYYGYAGQINYIVEKMKEEKNWGSKTKVIATGGLASFISNEAKCIDIIDRYLTLDGLRLIYDKNKNNLDGGKNGY